MRNLVLAVAMAAMCLTGCSKNQAADDNGSGPSPELRAQMQQARSAAKTATLADLSGDHRTKVNDVVSKFDDGSLDLQAAATQIDGILSPSESYAVFGEQKKMRDAMRAAAESAGGNGATGSGYGRRNGIAGGRRPPDAGRFLLSVLAAPDKFREAARNASG